MVKPLRSLALGEVELRSEHAGLRTARAGADPRLGMLHSSSHAQIVYSTVDTSSPLPMNLPKKGLPQKWNKDPTDEIGWM